MRRYGVAQGSQPNAWFGFDDWPWEHSQGFNEWVFFGEFYGQTEDKKFGVIPCGVDVDKNPPKQFIVTDGAGSNYPNGLNVMNPLDDSTAFRVYNAMADPWEEFDDPHKGYMSDALNGNLRVNGRTEEDNTITGFSNYRQDPVQEVLLLPFTAETAFLVTILRLLYDRNPRMVVAISLSCNRGQMVTLQPVTTRVCIRIKALALGKNQFSKYQMAGSFRKLMTANLTILTILLIPIQTRTQ